MLRIRSLLQPRSSYQGSNVMESVTLLAILPLQVFVASLQYDFDNDILLPTARSYEHLPQ